MQLKDFLNTKPLFYKEIDYTRMPRAWDSIKGHLKPFKIIHIIGTNGKGSTGRFLAQILRLNGSSVGHYTSPHIFDFNERFWLNGSVVSDEILQSAHERLQEILSDEFKVKTSYFEYATLLCAVLFNGCDYFVCEAGMGGELDATNVFDKLLSVFTPIGYDHTAVLGDSIEQISSTKFKALSSGGVGILNDTMDKNAVLIAKEVALSRNAKLKFASEILNSDDLVAIEKYALKHTLPDFLISNLTLAVASSKEVLGKFEIENLGELDLRGRCERVAENLFVDVGHNELGAIAIAKRFQNQRLNLIYNCFADKDFKAVLNALKPVVKSIFIYEYASDERGLATEEIRDYAAKIGLRCENFGGLKREDILKTDEKYLVFGSFYLVEAFLRQFDAS